MPRRVRLFGIPPVATKVHSCLPHEVCQALPAVLPGMGGKADECKMLIMMSITIIMMIIVMILMSTQASCHDAV